MYLQGRFLSNNSWVINGSSHRLMFRRREILDHIYAHRLLCTYPKHALKKQNGGKSALYYHQTKLYSLILNRILSVENLT